MPPLALVGNLSFDLVDGGRPQIGGAPIHCGRALRMPYGDVDKIAKMVPFELSMTLERALQISPDLKESYDTNTDVKKLIDSVMPNKKK